MRRCAERLARVATLWSGLKDEGVFKRSTRKCDEAVAVRGGAAKSRYANPLTEIYLEEKTPQCKGNPQNQTLQRRCALPQQYHLQQ